MKIMKKKIKLFPQNADKVIMKQNKRRNEMRPQIKDKTVREIMGKVAYLDAAQTEELLQAMANMFYQIDPEEVTNFDTGHVGSLLEDAATVVKERIGN